MRGAFAFLLLVALIGCNGRDRRGSVLPRDVGARVDGGATGDTGEPFDGGPIDDGGAVDGGESMDGSGPTDTGSSLDGSAPDGSAPDGSAPDAGATPDSGFPPFCAQTCTVPNDCAQATNALQDADNWLCDAGYCEYRGCLNTQECNAVFGGGYVCVQHPGYLVPSCVQACAGVQDCAVASSPLFGEDNYQCLSGGCRWLGCNNQDECRQTFNDPTYACEAQPGLPFQNCVRPCSAPTDCGAATPAYDADNYACTNARCVYLGCHNNAECEASNMSGVWECR